MGGLLFLPGEGREWEGGRPRTFFIFSKREKRGGKGEIGAEVSLSPREKEKFARARANR